MRPGAITSTSSVVISSVPATVVASRPTSSPAHNPPTRDHLRYNTPEGMIKSEIDTEIKRLMDKYFVPLELVRGEGARAGVCGGGEEGGGGHPSCNG